VLGGGGVVAIVVKFKENTVKRLLVIKTDE
jgi:hypothetical protein